ncbi:tnf receptor-associated factor 7 [Capsaspora owczarzaki ATCC 30864]|uniref:Tnf receptor-associated factor 7 n=1 Tax=Capsaspora owczarzaki (strain ATCC 30864) TaxID=595528 RepID=A0A0D2VU97_CAPO3|nr:tnf receptor-associated factor 7 [Capsaspora owczarzaki ATCC 30864]KJE94942.1 tnf receptor-associated factor 7 [Capsaspora owczarzaki ATCC 30864]|eukprot:XP_004346151.2 tnf receptor-associated factor 7 [Capsaspora owczarzaki ATCC 30864]
MSFHGESRSPSTPSLVGSSSGMLMNGSAANTPIAAATGGGAANFNATVLGNGMNSISSNGSGGAVSSPSHYSTSTVDSVDAYQQQQQLQLHQQQLMHQYQQHQQQQMLHQKQQLLQQQTPSRPSHSRTSSFTPSIASSQGIMSLTIAPSPAQHGQATVHGQLTPQSLSHSTHHYSQGPANGAAGSMGAGSMLLSTPNGNGNNSYGNNTNSLMLALATPTINGMMSPQLTASASGSTNGELLVDDAGPSGSLTVYTTPPSEKLYCGMCGKIFTDPVIAQCGHTFCRHCVEHAPAGRGCPTHKMQLSKSVLLPNLTVSEQIGDLLIYCRYRLKRLAHSVNFGLQSVNGDTSSADAISIASTTNGDPAGATYELDDAGCPLTVKLSQRHDHESTCDYAPTRCPNSTQCPIVLKRDLETHLQICEHTPCAHRARGCPFKGAAAQVKLHLASCRYESIKELLKTSEDQILTLTQALHNREEELSFMRTMLAKVSEKMEQLSITVERRLDLVDKNMLKVAGESADMLRQLNDVKGEVLARMGVVDEIEFITTNTFKCKGTFVGHQGPVWALVVYKDLLFSGSSDETIKVWSATEFKCKNTLTGDKAHKGIVHALCIHAHKLYSGSSDSTIKVWDLDTLELLDSLDGHDSPVCTLAIANDMLFSGSHKVIKVWDLGTHKHMKDLTGLNHWARALVATETYLYSGSYKTIFIHSLETLECVRVLNTHGGSVYSLAVTDRHIICGTYENSIHVWDVNNYSDVAVLSGHLGAVYALAVLSTRNSARLFSGSYDNTIRVWNLENFQCVQTLIRHGSSVDTLAASKGRVFSGAADNTIKVWQ